MLLREPKRLRIDIFYEMLEKSRTGKVKQAKGKISRTDSDVSLSESLYDSLFSEDDGKSDNNDRSRSRQRNKSLDMFEVVTACLDNMAAKTGITKIQKQSHMDRWLQKAKSKTPEKTKGKTLVPIKKEEKKDPTVNVAKKMKSTPKKTLRKSYSLRKSNESQNILSQANSRKQVLKTETDVTSNTHDSSNPNISQDQNEICVVTNVESFSEKTQDKDKSIESASSNETATTESPKESSINTNGTCDSETYTEEMDESIDGANNSALDEDKSDFSIPNSDAAVKDLNAECSFITELQDSSNTDMNLEMAQAANQSESNLNLNDEDAASQNSDPNLHKVIEQEKKFDGLESSSLNSDKQSIAQPGSPTEDLDLLKYDSDREDFIELKQNSDNNSSKDTMNVVQEIPATTVCTNVETHTSNATCNTDNLADKNENPLDTDVNTGNSQSETAKKDNIENSYDSTDIIKSAGDYKENDKLITQENIKSITQKSQENDLDKEIDIDENDADAMSIDYDSDSERLPYSPLSNLGNNSDDNLSLDELPFVSDKVPEFGEQNLCIANEQDADELSTEVEDDLNKFNCNSNKYHSNKIDKNNPSKTSENYKSVVGNSAGDKLELNGHISDENATENINSKENYNKEVDLVENKVDLTNNVEDDTTQDNIDNGYRGENVRELEMASKEVRIYVTDKTLKKSETIKENGYHDTNGDFDVETASIHSEDSVNSTKSESRNKPRSKQDKQLEDPLLNPEFVKYMELRQDAIMDENPDLNENQIVAYLYKTWLYEESVKSDDKKNDDLRELNLVKGLNQPGPEEHVQTKRTLSLKKHRVNKNNSIQRYLRKNKDDCTERHKETDEVCSVKKNNARENMIRDDDDDEILSKEDEKQESLSIVQKDTKILKDKDNYQETSNTGNVIEFTDSKETSSSNFVHETNERLCSDFKKPAAAVSLETSSLVNLCHSQEPERIETETGKEQQTDTINSAKESLSEDKGKHDGDKDSLDSEDSEAPLIKSKLRSKAKKEKEGIIDRKVKDEDADTISINSEDSEVSVSKRRKKFSVKKIESAMEDPEFVKYLELRQDSLIDENPDLTQNEIITYLYQTYLYEENNKSETKKSDEMKESNLVKGLKDTVQEPIKVKRKVLKTEKTEKDGVDDEMSTKEKPKRKSVKPFYNEEYSDIEEELEVFEIFKPKQRVVPSEAGLAVSETEQLQRPVEVYDEVEMYFAELTKPKPNIFKGLIREKVCEICENIGTLVKCKGCNGMFHVDCVKKQVQIVEVSAPTRGRKKKKKTIRRAKNTEEFDTDDRSQDTIEDNLSVEELIEADPHTVDADALENVLSAKMKEILDSSEKVDYESYSSDDGLDWNETLPGKCEIVDVKLKPRNSITDMEYADFKCNNCQKYNTPVCFVCKNAVSKNDSTKRQKCHVAHCHKYYHLECLDHWPQTQFNGGEPSKTNKKINEYFEALTCPRHVCHTCVSDDPRGCKTRFSGDKLARCVRCPATYHSFTKCLPAGTQILSASHIICPRHYEHRYIFFLLCNHFNHRCGSCRPK